MKNSEIRYKRFKQDDISFCDAGIYCTAKTIHPVSVIKINEYLICRSCFKSMKKAAKAEFIYELKSQMD